MSLISEFTYASQASRGARAYQEDSSQVWRPARRSGHCQPILAVLADGMGGHVSGETASQLACDQYVRSFSGADGGIASRMEHSLLASNEALTNAIEDNGALKGMGCTLIASYMDEEGLRWVSVGDSALLLYRNGTLRRLNADHSVGAMLNKQVGAGLIAPETAKSDPRRRALRSALTGGTIPLKDCEFDAYPLQASDLVILATDGLDVLSGNEIALAIQKHENQDAEAVAGSLIAAVEQKRERYQDNTTVIVLRVAPSSRLQDQLPKSADDPQQDADMAKTVLINPHGKSATSELIPRSNPTSDAAKGPGRKSWWPRVKLFLLAVVIVGFGEQAILAYYDPPCRTGGINQSSMDQTS